ncbi:arylamine n-acetyltransferase 2 [Fusarium globosum]|uniref:Arylamine n-acetyltransferase 2 n=1 Tax=Fusarium globosum TaxID=78864 RepID=A0A8H5YBX7_9HYPO|nr:arylamine n-acetyltransferase 2 [Fusarium globosum]
MSAIYSEAQVAGFLKHLQVPQEFYVGNEPILDHAFLKVLHQHMIATVPYDNLTLHYSSHRNITLEPQALYQKIVADGRGRGGYCMESNLFFCYMLRALGFQVYPVGYRSLTVPRVHIVNVVTLPDNSRWVMDASFGGDGPTQPMPLVEGAEWVNMGTQDARLIKDFIPGQTELTSGRRLWIYQCRNSRDQPWTSFYAFSHSVEWLPADFEISNCYTGTSPRSFQTTTVLIVKFLLRESKTSPTGEEIYGKRMLVNDVVKENPGGKTKVLEELKTEGERVEALKEYFGIDLTTEEREAIKGFQTEIKSE